ncbi:MAG: peptidyl-dipeptidase Dcp [Planctomycetota bacterium]|nr:MAG: peptidyl-dipeptidase Dcp [Planctomycetota bacterium]
MESLLTADAEGLRKAASEDLAAAREAVASFKALPADASSETLLSAWDAVGRPLNRSGGLVHLFFQVHPDEKVRGACAEIEQELSRFHTELSLDREVFARLEGADPSTLSDPVARRLLEHELRDFRRSGVDRDDATRERVIALREKLVELGQAFSRNIASDVREIVLDSVADLDGLPDDYIAAHPPGDDGKIHVTTNPPDATPFMQFCSRREHRRALHLVMSQRATPDNLPVLDELIATRHELAGLLGYTSWAHYITEDKMIKTPERAAEFIAKVRELTGARMEQEIDEIWQALKAECPEAERVRDFDRLYFREKIKRAKFDFDVRDVRPYLPYDAVRDGVLDTVSKLYGVQIRKATEIATWHADVEAYEIHDDGKLLARFFLDMHPRPDKFKHAAMFDLVSGLRSASGTGDTVPRAALACNMPQPTESDPALLDPDQLSTYFHEVGHLMHHLLAGDHRWLGVSGIATEWDFVEVPSQLFEEWGRDPALLAGFTRHHESGEPIPADLVTRMNAAEDYGKGIVTRAQMYYASLSLECFRRDPATLDTSALVAELKPQFVPMPVEEGSCFQAAFGHLEGYSALYYTYMWSLVLAKDIFSAFEGDLMNTDIARRYRDAVLGPGGSKDAEELVADFLGRPSSFEAFEAWLAA